MALEAAKRVSRKESMALRRGYANIKKDENFRFSGLENFYSKHLKWAAAVMGVDKDVIATEMAEHKSWFFGPIRDEDAAKAISRVELESPNRLASIVLESKLKAGN